MIFRVANNVLPQRMRNPNSRKHHNAVSHLELHSEHCEEGEGGGECPGDPTECSAAREVEIPDWLQEEASSARGLKAFQPIACRRQVRKGQ